MPNLSLMGRWGMGMGMLWASLALSAPCEPPASTTSAQLLVSVGYTEFISAAALKPFKEALPRVGNAEIDSILHAKETIWYDENSMVYTYQDSIEVVVGVRANCVGRKVGERNANNVIGKLLNFFGPDFRFLFPFRKAAGTDNVTNEYVLNFWKPPKRGEQVLPIKWWKLSSRGRWRWVFPVGTVFGEVLYEKAPNGHWYVFEIRTRKRYLDGWQVNVFRPFVTAWTLADAIESKYKPLSENTQKFVDYLKNKDTLVAHEWSSKPYGKIFPRIQGALDPLPPLDDSSLVIDLLTQTPFISAEGRIWKENGRLETYAPSSLGEFSIVPKGYEMGMVPVNEISCRTCHSETGRKLGELEFDIILYGEIWGEDQIFTWHPFEPNAHIYDTWDQNDGSRVMNPRLLKAKLLQNEKPSDKDPDYKPLPTVFKPDF